MGAGGRELLPKNMRKFCGLVEMLYIMIVVSLMLVGTTVKTHQVIHLKFKVFIVCKLYLNKADPKMKKRIIKTKKLTLRNQGVGVGQKTLFEVRVFRSKTKWKYKLFEICDNENMKLTEYGQNFTQNEILALNYFIS